MLDHYWLIDVALLGIRLESVVQREKSCGRALTKNALTIFILMNHSRLISKYLHKI
jgi:hypothetical protein